MFLIKGRKFEKEKELKLKFAKHVCDMFFPVSLMVV